MMVLEGLRKKVQEGLRKKVQEVLHMMEEGVHMRVVVLHMMGLLEESLLCQQPQLQLAPMSPTQ